MSAHERQVAFEEGRDEAGSDRQSILYARFFPQEGTASTPAALDAVLTRFGRFCQLYTDRDSHQVARVLRTLGIEHILARTPEARGRSERRFGTLQGRLRRSSASTASAATV